MNNKKFLTEKHYVVLIALFCSLLWGSAFPVLKISYGEMHIAPNDLNSRIILAGLRFLLAGLILFILVVFLMKKSIKVNTLEFKQLSLLGALQTALQYFFFYNGVANTSGMKSALLSSIGNFFVVILAHFIYKNDRINSRKVIGLITGFAGIILVNTGASSFNLSFSLKGEGFLILSSLVSAFGIILAKDLSKNIHPFIANGWQMFIGAIFLLAVGLLNFKPNSMVFTTKAWILLIYSAFLSAIAYSLWYSLLKYNKAGEITLYRFAIPISGALLSAILIPEEKFTLNLIIAMVLVSIGILVVNSPYRENK